MIKLECYECKFKKQENYICINCNIKTCSTECLIKHRNKAHLTPKLKQNSIITNSNNNSKNNLITTGEYIKNLKDPHPIYNFQNFEMKKHIVLGKGAYGDVYYARNKVNNSYYAVKQVNKEKLIFKGGSINLILKEINIHRRLVHKNIVRLYGHHEDNDNFYLIMEYYPNGNLFQKLKQSQNFDEKKACYYFTQTCLAVNFLHSNNLVHRDLKPENLLLDSNNNIKLCDFGWCTEISFGNRVTICGTREYMAPEIINELPYNCSIDIWSLGVLLYELLHGYSPFNPENFDSISIKEIKENMKEIKLIFDKKLSQNCCDLIKKLLNPNPNERIKLKEALSHPWILSFYKNQSSIKQINGKDKPIKDINNVPLNKLTKGLFRFKIELMERNKKNMSLSNELIENLINNNISEEIIINRKKSSNFFEKVLNKINERNKKNYLNKSAKKTEIKTNNDSNTFRLLKKNTIDVSNNNYSIEEEQKDPNTIKTQNIRKEKEMIRRKNKAKTLKIITHIDINKVPFVEAPNSSGKSKITFDFKQMYNSNPNEKSSNTKYLKVDLFRPNNSLNENSLSKGKEIDLTFKKCNSKDNGKINSRHISLVKKEFLNTISPKNYLENSLYRSNEIRSKSLDKIEIKNNLTKNEIIVNALDILEKSEKIDCVNVHRVVKEKETTMWSKISDFFNPFKCGSTN